MPKAVADYQITRRLHILYASFVTLSGCHIKEWM